MLPDAVSELRRRGRLPAAAVLEALAVSRPTLMRAARAAGEDIVALGRARRSAYAARRPLAGLPTALPLYAVDTDGAVHELGRLVATEPAPGMAWLGPQPPPWPLADADQRDGWWADLPYPLRDLCPSGQQGRALLQRQGGREPLNSADEALRAAAAFSAHAPGHLIVGEAACRRWLAHVSQARVGGTPDALPDEGLAAAYAARATAAPVGEDWWPGEAPAFTALRQDGPRQPPRHVVVRHAALGPDPQARRAADRLAAEHLALRVLAESGLGVPVAANALLASDSHRFLELSRPDRVGLLGRAPRLSLAALGAAGLNPADPLPDLAARGWLAPAEAALMARLLWFARLIGAEAACAEALAFTAEGGQLALAPVTGLAPADVDGTAAAPPLLPLPQERAAWTDAARAARRFWQSAARDRQLSDACREQAITQALRLRALTVG